jgi:uncharacterized membrane protein YjjP (DUF1212 family)
VFFPDGFIIGGDVFILAMIFFRGISVELMHFTLSRVLSLNIFVKIFNLLINDILEWLQREGWGWGLELGNHIENSIVYNF